MMILCVENNKRGLWEKLLINQFIPKLYTFLVFLNANFSTSSFSYEFLIIKRSDEYLRRENKQKS